jgi:hypothetical protein
VPAKNIHHNAVIVALRADGWLITDDPFRLTYGDRRLYVDLGAERNVVAAERDRQRIAVEVQSFLDQSPVRSLQEAVGQYVVYRVVLAEHEPERTLYMAVSQQTYDAVFADRFGRLIVDRLQIRLLVFDTSQERVAQWIG